jgi:hypothetical protein
MGITINQEQTDVQPRQQLHAEAFDFQVLVMYKLICSNLRAVNRVGTLTRGLTKFEGESGKREIRVGKRCREID